MPVPAEVHRRCVALLDPGEAIQYIVPTLSAGVSVTVYLADCFIVVTDRRIAVALGGAFRRNRPKEIIQQFPRDTRLGPLDTSLAPTLELGGRVYEIPEEYIAVVAAADAELDGPEALPRDPFPYL